MKQSWNGFYPMFLEKNIRDSKTHLEKGGIFKESTKLQNYSDYFDMSSGRIQQWLFIIKMCLSKFKHVMFFSYTLMCTYYRQRYFNKYNPITFSFNGTSWKLNLNHWQKGKTSSNLSVNYTVTSSWNMDDCKRRRK